MKFLPLILPLILLCVVGCARTPDYITNDFPGVWFWHQSRPTTKHGICAIVEGPVDGKLDDRDGSVWGVELPDPKPNKDGMSSGPTPEYQFNTGREAAAWAEKNCPTGAK
jgi:hypothetical protein